MKESCPGRRHLIAGYSFGTAVAYHIAQLLTEEGSPSPLVLLDGAPSYVSSRMDGLVTTYAEGHVTDVDDRRWFSVVYAFLRLLVNTDYLKVNKLPLHKPYLIASFIQMLFLKLLSSMLMVRLFNCISYLMFCN